MIPLENQVCSLPLAQRLKELRVKQESYFVWAKLAERPEKWRIQVKDRQYEDEFSAFTVAELGGMLPQRIEQSVLDARFPWKEEDEDHNERVYDELREVLPELWDHYDHKYEEFGYPLQRTFRDGFTVDYYFDDPDAEYNETVFEVKGATEADARATMLIYLLENGLIE